MRPKSAGRFHYLYDLWSLPWVLTALFHNTNRHEDHALTRWRWYRFGWKVYRNTRKVETASGYRAHLLMAAKLLELPRTLKGAVVECGCFKGGSTVNLSLICDLVDRNLIVYDSFEGLPVPDDLDDRAQGMAQGMFAGTLEEVRRVVSRHGKVDRCEFRKGWFSESLPEHREKIALLFLDVDFDGSIHDCLVNLWPHVHPHGFVFTDDYARPTKSAVFYSERYWHTYFDREPPGLLGAGSGVGLGQMFTGLSKNNSMPLEFPGSVAYTRPRFDGSWTYFPPSPGET